MADRDKIDERFLELTKQAKDMQVGDRKWFEWRAILVDVDRHCWVNPRAEPADDDAEKTVELERLEAGFRLVLNDFGKSHHWWETSPTPRRESAADYDWIPVVEIKVEP